MTLERGKTLAPSEDLQASHIPLFPGWGVVVDAIDYAVRRQLAEIDLTGVTGWWGGATIPANALEAMLEFVGVGGLDTTVLGEQFRRNIYQGNAVFRGYRGTNFVLEEFGRETGIEFDTTLVEDGNGRNIAVDVFIEPPLDRVPGTDWQRYMRRAFRWLLPPDLELRNFETGVLIEDRIYAYNALKVTREVFV